MITSRPNSNRSSPAPNISSGSSGPILAGRLIDANYWGTGWRMIFLVNIPLGLFAALGGRAHAERHHAAGDGRVGQTPALAAGSAL